MKAFINKNICIFCGMCGGACPSVFFADYDGRSIALDVEIADELFPQVKHAQAVCPVGAITITDFP